MEINYSRFSLAYTLFSFILSFIFLLIFLTDINLQNSLKNKISDQVKIILSNIESNIKNTTFLMVNQISKSLEFSVLNQLSNELKPQDLNKVKKAFNNSRKEILNRIEMKNSGQNLNFIDSVTNKMIDRYLFNSTTGRIILFLIIFSILMLFKIPLYLLSYSLIFLIGKFIKKKN